MPELPDLTVYVEALERRIGGQPLLSIRLASPFVLRTVDPPPAAAVRARLQNVTRLGKRLVFRFDNGIHFVLHLMIAGRLHWKKPSAKLGGRAHLAAFEFPDGLLVLTEASTKQRASLHVLPNAEAVASFDPGGLEPLTATPDAFMAALRRENHTLKRALTDPHILAGVGNAYSDEILHRARLSPMLQTQKVDPATLHRLHAATQDVLTEWTQRLRAQVGDAFPEKVTAFRPEMAVHGKHGQPCPRCGAPVQRVRYADNELNYCAPCQTEGRLLADRALSRLLKGDWPKTLDELERKMRA